MQRLGWWVCLAVAVVAVGCGDESQTGGHDTHIDAPGDVGFDGPKPDVQAACEADADCDDADACTTDTCTEGACVNAARTDACRLDGVCLEAGAASPLTACKVCDPAQSTTEWSNLACDDGNPCTADVCDTALGCRAIPDDSAVCDDGHACSTDDHCAAGACVASACECEDDGDCEGLTVGPCQRAACVDFVCAPAPDAAKNGAACDDGDLCTKTDVCAAGTCGGEAFGCSQWDGPCATGTCTGVGCKLTLAAVGASCDSPLAGVPVAQCTEAGNCFGPWDPTAALCETAADCDDGLACTVDTCEAGTGLCTNAPEAGACVLMQQCWEAGDAHPFDDELVCDPDTDPLGWSHVPCDDEDPCTSGDVWVGGVCVGQPVVCSVWDGPCTTGVCVGGACQVALAEEGAACESPLTGVPEATCTEAGNCLGDWDAELLPCEVDTDCDDGLACTVDACDAETGACANAPAAETCLLLGRCWTGGEAHPNDAELVCDPAKDPLGWSPAPCDDGDTCTVGDVVVGGVCAGTAMDCSAFADACHAASCQDGACVASPTPAASCDDANPCTSGDACTAGGVCEGLWDEDLCACADDGDCGAAADACNVGRCDLETHACVADPTPGVSCDDGDACTSADTCSAGGSCGGESYACDDGAACTTDSCNGDGTCTFALAAATCLIDGACVAAGATNDGNLCQLCDPSQSTTAWTHTAVACDDGEACTKGDVCQAGACVGTPYVCDDGKDCTTGVCNGDGTCTHQIKDGKCLIVGACYQAGTANPGNACEVCAPAADKFEWTANTAACDDGVACTQSDACSGGTCAGAPYGCDDAKSCTTDTCLGDGTCDFALNAGKCLIGGACYEAGQANPDNPCQSCVPGTSTSAWTNNTASCDDGNACTQADTCQAGVCVGSNPVICSAASQCHEAGTCNPATGMCSNPNKANGTGCDDGNACTQSDSCQSGVCVGASPVVCAALDQCHDAGTCNPATGVCSNPNKANGTGCSDGNACTQSDTCQAGVCVGASPVVCAAASQCHDAGTCNPLTGVCSNPLKANGSSCDDGNACTQTDSCQAGACLGSNPVTCSAASQCHDAGTCNPATGACSNPPKANGTACNDGNACTQTDTCQGGTCAGASPVVCTAISQCHDAGTCNPSTGACSTPVKSNGAACNDGNACTQSDTCQSGSCVGASPVVCTALDQCHTAGTCNPATGVCTNPNKANGTACNDGNACTQSDTCQSGSCVGASPVTCSAASQCHDVGTCNPATGACSNPAKANGTGCNDGNLCTQSDTCQSGACVGSSPVTCTAASQCHTAGTCNPATGTCSQPVKANGSACNDGNLCTQSDTCQSGTCVGASPVTCSAPGPCYYAGTCQPATGTCSAATLKPEWASCGNCGRCSSTGNCFGQCSGSQTHCCEPGICINSGNDCP